MDAAYFYLRDLGTPVAPPSYPVSDRCIGLIPLFLSPGVRSTNLEAYVQAAVNSRASAIQNTDAVEAGVAIKYYVERAAYPAVAPAFGRCGVERQDILFFSVYHPSVKHWGRFSKKMALYYDVDLSGYETVVAWDADTFFPVGSVFSFASVQTSAHITYCGVREQWWSQASHAARWVKKIESLAYPPGRPYLETREAVGFDGFNGPMQHPIGYLWSYPARRFHRDKPDIVQWFRDNAAHVGCDEVALSMVADTFCLDLASMEAAFGYREPPFSERFSQGHPYLHGRPHTTVERIQLEESLCLPRN